MTKHYKHLLGRYKIGEADHAIAHAKKQFEALMKKSDSADEWVEIQVYLYDTEKD